MLFGCCCTLLFVIIMFPPLPATLEFMGRVGPLPIIIKLEIAQLLVAEAPPMIGFFVAVLQVIVNAAGAGEELTSSPLKSAANELTELVAAPMPVKDPLDGSDMTAVGGWIKANPDDVGADGGCAGGGVHAAVVGTGKKESKFA